MLSLVAGARWRDVKAALAETPELLGFRDGRGRNWLHLCCGANAARKKLDPADTIKTADALLAAGLDVNAEAFCEGEWKATPLWYAVARGENRALARHLLKRGSDPNHCLWAAGFRDDVDMIRLLARGGAEIDPVAEDATPFLSAIQWSHFAAAEELLKLGADPNFQDSKRMTALHYLLKKGSDEKHVRMLIDHGARGDIPNREGVTAAAILRKKRDAGFRRLAEHFS
jgi:ankyrin repeat protein